MGYDNTDWLETLTSKASIIYVTAQKRLRVVNRLILYSFFNIKLAVMLILIVYSVHFM